MTKRILSAFLFVAIIISCTSCRLLLSRIRPGNIRSSEDSSLSSEVTSDEATSGETSSEAAASSAASSRSVSSAIPQKTALQLFNEADEKLSSLMTCEYEKKETGRYKVNNQEYTVTIIDYIKVDGIKKIFTVEETIIGSQGTVNKSAYYENGKYYVKENGSSYQEKSFYDYYSTLPDIWGEYQYPPEPEITESDLISSKTSKSGESTIVTLVIKSEKYVKQLKDYYKQMNVILESASMENIEIEAKINKNGYFEKVTTHQKAQMSYNYQTSDSDITYEMTIINPGAPVTVTLPSVQNLSV